MAATLPAHGRRPFAAGTAAAPGQAWSRTPRPRLSCLRWSPAPPGVLPGAGGWAVAAQHLGPVRVPRGRGAIGIEDQGPAPPVYDDVMMVKTQKNALVEAGLAAAGPGRDVVHLTRRRGLPAPPWPLAMA